MCYGRAISLCLRLANTLHSQADQSANSQDGTEGDHPLNTDQNSRWKEYFRVRPVQGAVPSMLFDRSAVHTYAAASKPKLDAFARQDAEMLEQIERDVMRTHPDMHFFSGDDPIAVRHRKVRMYSPTSCTVRLIHAAMSTSRTVPCAAPLLTRPSCCARRR